MALTRRSENNTVYLEVKHYCLWRALKKPVEGCDEVTVTNPKTGAVMTKHGFSFRTVSGNATKLEKYDTGKKYATRYFGFKLHLTEGAEDYVVAMPYSSQILRRFLRVARSIDWTLPISITIFKGKKKAGESGAEETGIWFQQSGATVKAYYTKEEPHGMPAATQDRHTQEWDFRAQHSWLVDRLQAETVSDIAAASRRVAPPIEPDANDAPHEDYIEDMGEPSAPITDDDVPF